MEGEWAAKVFEMIGDGGKCTTACLRSRSMEDVFRLRMGRGVRGEEELEVESMAKEEEYEEG